MKDLAFGTIVLLYMFAAFLIPWGLALWLGVIPIMSTLIGAGSWCFIMFLTCEILEGIDKVQKRERDWFLANFKRIEK